MDFSTFITARYLMAPANKINPGKKGFFRINHDTKRKLMMRIQLLTIMLFAACLQISAAGFSQNVTISEKNSSLETVLNKIEQQSGYDVFFQTELLAKSNKVTVDVKNLSLEKTLEKVFKGQPLSYAIIGHTIVLKEKPGAIVPLVVQANIVTGKVVDADTKEPLVGATITIKGAAKTTFAGLDGSFKIDVNGIDNPVLAISFIGYTSKEVPVAGSSNVGEIALKSSATGMSEVVINGDVAIDRKTPIAVTTINPRFIEEKLGNQDIPQLLGFVPGVMATAQGGGYGDSRVSIRGFSSASGQGNVALTVNGIPVNDMESGAIFWSDFSGLTDVTTSLQVQRGLGASKIIVPSFGGTINITTRNTDAEKGGYISQYIGSDSYLKTAVLISTGLDKNGWAMTFQGSRTSGDGNADGLNFLGYNYFFNLSKVLSPNQTISFSVMGATQTHGQRPSQSIANYQNAPQGIRWNYQNSVKDGDPITPYNNFFSKPLFSINHDWTINDKSSLSTVLYGTYGTGGGGSIGGAAAPRIAGTNIYTPFDYTAVEKTNAVSPDGSAGTYLYASHNDHVEYGIRSTFKTLLAKYLDLSAGIDARYYQGTHYQVVTDLLAADYVKNNFTAGNAFGTRSGDINNPTDRAVVGDKIGYYNKDGVQMLGAFAQAEYSKKAFSAFITLSGSSQRDQRTDYFNYLNSDPAQTSPWVSFFTYQAKTGANYNINEQMNVFANIGYITKPPFFDKGVFQNFTNVVNPNPVNEKLFSYELGYGFKLPGFSAKLNLYRSSYNDQTLTGNFTDPTGNIFTANVSGVNSLHQGAELELMYRPIKEVNLHGMLSLGDWYYTNNAGPASVYNSSQQVVSTIPVAYLKGMKKGDAPQTQGALGLDLDVLPQFRFGADAYYYGNYYSRFNFASVTAPGRTPYIIPSWTMFNLNAVFKFKIAGLDGSLIANVFNLMNTKYISDSFDASALGDPTLVSVYYGLGRTFTTGVKIKF
ncbi:MAG TPA: TonB-dependent receptor [Mucilaginibacter sp.]|jgi:outer membrane cobalamin receptor